MRMGKELGRLGGVPAALLGLAAMAQTGCTMPVDGGSPSKAAEPVGKTAAAQAAVYGNVNCQGSNVNVVQALPLASGGYQGSVLALLESLCTSGTGCDANIYNFTSIYYDIPGAAGYYYILRSFNTVDIDNANPTAGDYWISIPIIDSQKDVANPVGYYPTYPGLPTIRFPIDGSVMSVSGFTVTYYDLLGWAYANPSTWPETNRVPEGQWVGMESEILWWPFVLSTTNYNEFVNVMASEPSNDSEVLAQDETCVLIVDENGNTLDFSAHLAEWDPQSGGCGGCVKGK